MFAARPHCHIVVTARISRNWKLLHDIKVLQPRYVIKMSSNRHMNDITVAAPAPISRIAAGAVKAHLVHNLSGTEKVLPLPVCRAANDAPAWHRLNYGASDVAGVILGV